MWRLRPLILSARWSSIATSSGSTARHGRRAVSLSAQPTAPPSPLFRGKPPTGPGDFHFGGPIPNAEAVRQAPERFRSMGAGRARLVRRAAAHVGQGHRPRRLCRRGRLGARPRSQPIDHGAGAGNTTAHNVAGSIRTRAQLAARDSAITAPTGAFATTTQRERLSRAHLRRSVRSIARRERARSDRYVARYLASAQSRTSPAHRDRPSDGAYGTERVGSRRPGVSARACVG